MIDSMLIDAVKNGYSAEEIKQAVLTLEFNKKSGNKKVSEENKRKKQAKKTSDKKQAKTIENMENIRLYLKENGESKTNDIAEKIGLSPARTRAIIAEMDDVIGTGGNSNRRYNLK